MTAVTSHNNGGKGGTDLQKPKEREVSEGEAKGEGGKENEEVKAERKRERKKKQDGLVIGERTSSNCNPFVDTAHPQVFYGLCNPPAEERKRKQEKGAKGQDLG